MGFVLPGYKDDPATWFYLSLLLIVAVYFRFGRIWSLRNLDLALALSLSPGLLLVHESPTLGYSLLFAVTGLLLVRMIVDQFLDRRPKIEQNLNTAGMTFLGVSAFAFLMTIVITKPPAPATVDSVRRGGDLLKRQAPAEEDGRRESGPTASLIASTVVPISRTVAAATPAGTADDPQDSEQSFETIAARFLALFAHLAVVLGLVFIGRRIFHDHHAGVGMATLYLLLPCTAYEVTKVNHVLPAALILWAVLMYRRPTLAGGLMALACGTLFFPVFLIPLWTTFYGRRWAPRFLLSTLAITALLVGTLIVTSADTHSFRQQTFGSIEWAMLTMQDGESAGFWNSHDAAYRIPMVVAYGILLVWLTIWPRKKNLETLLSSSAALIVATQFWYPQQGGIYILWYLPLVLTILFRPRLAHLLPPDISRIRNESRLANRSAGTEIPHRELATAGSTTGKMFR